MCLCMYVRICIHMLSWMGADDGAGLSQKFVCLSLCVR